MCDSYILYLICILHVLCTYIHTYRYTHVFAIQIYISYISTYIRISGQWPYVYSNNNVCCSPDHLQIIPLFWLGTQHDAWNILFWDGVIWWLESCASVSAPRGSSITWITNADHPRFFVRHNSLDPFRLIQDGCPKCLQGLCPACSVCPFGCFCS